MKEKILKMLKDLHKDFNTQTYDVVATMLANTGLVTDENLEDIATKSLVPLQAAQAEADRRVSKIQKENQELKAKLEAQNTEAGKGAKSETSTDTEEGENDKLKGLYDLINTLNTKVDGLQQDKVKSSRRERYEDLYKDLKNDKLKQAQMAKFDRMAFEDDADFETFLSGEKETAPELMQIEADRSLAGDRPIAGFTSTANGVSNLMKTYLDTKQKK